MRIFIPFEGDKIFFTTFYEIDMISSEIASINWWFPYGNKDAIYEKQVVHPLLLILIHFSESYFILMLSKTREKAISIRIISLKFVRNPN